MTSVAVEKLGPVLRLHPLRIMLRINAPEIVHTTA